MTSNLSSAELDHLAAVLPVLRGGLSDPSDIDGRPHRVVLNLVDGPGDAQADDTERAVAAFRSGARTVEIAQLGTVSCAKPKAGDLAGQVAVVTGGAGGLGFSVAQELTDRGASVALLDIAQEPVAKAAQTLGAVGFACDVTDPEAVNQCIQRVVASYGGIDILISNAGAALQGALLDLGDADFATAFKLNFWGHHYVARAVVRVMLAQGTGGALVFNVSKQAVNPGPDFGAYGTPKAALMALMRQYAVEHGPDGITSNAVNADRIRTGLMTDQMVEARSKARGLTPDQYMRGNLVKREVTGKDVAEAFVYLATARTSTGAVVTVDGGNVAAMMR